MKQASFNFLTLACLAACACSSSASDNGGGTGAQGTGAQGSGATSSGGSHANGGSSASASGSANASGGTSASGGSSSVAGSAALNGGASNAGSAGSSATGGASGGSAGSSNDPTVSTHPISVSTGKVFNVKDDFFNDGFVPPSPLANFGFPAHIVTTQRSDGSLDVAWLDYSNGGSQPMGLNAPATIYVTHVSADLSSGTTVSTGLQTYRLLGFTSDPSGNYYLAFNVDSPLRTHTDGDENNVNGNELHVAKFSDGTFSTKTWDSLIFGNIDNTKDGSKGDPGGAASGVLGYDTKNQQVVVYVGHSMSWGDNGTRHQAGFLAYIDPATGSEQASDRNLFMGANWWYSHNFNQRLSIDADGTTWTLAHGDAYPRQLGISSFTYASYKNNNAASDNGYFTINGDEGDNNTNAETGQFVHLSDGRFAIVHTSSQGRTTRDVHVVLTDNTSKATSDAWLTTNTGTIQATTTKIEVVNQNLWITYGLWDSNDRTNKTINWYSQVIGTDLKTVTAAKPIAGVEFDAPPPLFHFTAGPNNGALAWVSGNSMHTLTVNVAK